MTRKDRHLVYEGSALMFSGVGIALTVPALVNAHDSIALLAAAVLAVAWTGWGVFFIYRTNIKG